MNAHRAKAKKARAVAVVGVAFIIIIVVVVVVAASMLPCFKKAWRGVKERKKVCAYIFRFFFSLEGGRRKRSLSLRELRLSPTI